MRKILLSETAIYYGHVKMPEHFDINREIIFYAMLKQGIHDDLKETPFSRELDKIRNYMREFLSIKHNLSFLENFGSESMFFFPQERSEPLRAYNAMDVKNSPDYTCLYGVNVGKDSVKIIIRYDNHKLKECTKIMNLNNNDFVFFPSTLNYHIAKNKSEQLNCILNLSFRNKP
jgi:hypothetical protein|tara:strand:+ start:375 stop:896 length:522 start_codon:yes stop_codon:yes gene_type:complete